MLFCKYLKLNFYRSIVVLLVEFFTAILLTAVLVGWGWLAKGWMLVEAFMGVAVLLGAIHVSLPVLIVIQSYKLKKNGQAKACYANLPTLIPVCALVWLYCNLYKFGLIYVALIPLMVGGPRPH